MKKLTFRQEVLNILPYIFLHWLIEHNLLTKYLDNVVNDTAFSKKYSEEEKVFVLEQYCENYLGNILIFSFCWRESNEGSDFWRKCYYRWEEYYKNIKL